MCPCYLKQKNGENYFFLNVFALCLGGSEDFWTWCSHFLITGKAAVLGALIRMAVPLLSNPNLTVKTQSSQMMVTGGSCGGCLDHGPPWMGLLSQRSLSCQACKDIAGRPYLTCEADRSRISQCHCPMPPSFQNYLGTSCYAKVMNLVWFQPFWVCLLLKSYLLNFPVLKMAISTQQR